ncbi:MAG: ribonuclease P protein subunit [Candidatus Woesearchaeota archaeon]
MKNILSEEHIGREIIIESKNKSLDGLRGKIIDETKNTYLIKTEKGNKRIIKSQVKIIFLKERVRVDGKKLLKRPEERVNK